MNRASQFCLRAKHWQIFLLLFLVSVGQFVGSIAIMVASPSSEELGRGQLVGLGLLDGLLALVFLSYLWFAGSFLCSVTPQDLRPGLSFFRVAIFYPIVMAVMAYATAPFSLSGRPWPFGVFTALSLFAFVCGIYDINFVSKALAMAETGDPKVLGDYSGIFFLFLFFFPIGVWFIQPRINRLYADRKNAPQKGLFRGDGRSLRCAIFPGIVRKRGGTVQ